MSRKINILVTVEWNEEMEKYQEREWGRDIDEHYYDLVANALASDDYQLSTNACGYQSWYSIKRVDVEEKISLTIKDTECWE